MSYYNIDTILAEEEAIPVATRIPIAGAGYLEGDAGTSTVAEGSTIEVPLWLAKSLRERGWVDAESPRALTRKLLDSLQADPSVVNLRERSPYFYEMVNLALSLSGERMETARRILAKAWELRAKAIVNIANHVHNEDSSSKLRKLTSSERTLFDTSTESAQEYKLWKQRRNRGIKRARALSVNNTSAWKKKRGA